MSRIGIVIENGGGWGIYATHGGTSRAPGRAGPARLKVPPHSLSSLCSPRCFSALRAPQFFPELGLLGIFFGASTKAWQRTFLYFSPCADNNDSHKAQGRSKWRLLQGVQAIHC